MTVPALNGRKAAYMKVTSRTADDWPSLGVAVSFAFKDGAMSDPVVIVSAATEKVTRMEAAEKALQGAAPDDAALRRAGDAAADEVQTLSDAHGSAPTSGSCCGFICAAPSARPWTKACNRCGEDE